MLRRCGIAPGLLLSGIVVACAAAPHREPPGPTAARASADPSGASLLAGQELAARLFYRDGLAEDSRLLRYVNLVGRAAAFSRPDRDRFRFGVTQSGVPYAMALPGGIVVVSRGAITLMVSEAELAVLLSRELCRESSGEWSDPTGDCGEGADANSESARDACGAQWAAAAGYDAGAFLHYLEALELRADSARERSDLQWRIEIYRDLPEAHRGGVLLAERFRRSAVS